MTTKAVAREYKYDGNTCSEGRHTFDTLRAKKTTKCLDHSVLLGQDSMCYLEILIWLFYKTRKDREVGAEITFLPGKLLNSSGLTIIEIELLKTSA